jgi:hypothetical protein
VKARAALALTILLAAPTLAGAQTIPPSEMAGRERFRFQESPADRFMKPGPYAAPSVVELPPTTTGKRRARPSRHKKPR